MIFVPLETLILLKITHYFHYVRDGSIARSIKSEVTSDNPW